MEIQNEDKEIKHFTELSVWQKSHRLFINLSGDFKSLEGRKGIYFLVDQIFRSSGSISANIAEGFNSHSTKEYIRYLDIAKRTAAETENWLYKIKDLEILGEDICETRLNSCGEISRMIRGLITSLQNKVK